MARGVLGVPQKLRGLLGGVQVDRLCEHAAELLRQPKGNK
jgi:hypothetical protein